MLQTLRKEGRNKSRKVVAVLILSSMTCVYLISYMLLVEE